VTDESRKAHAVTILITGIGLVGTAFAQYALDRDEKLIFFDFQERAEYLRQRLGSADFTCVQGDVRDLPALVTAMQDHQVDTVVHTAGLIADKVSRPLYTGLQINVMGTVNVLEAVRLTGVRRFINISSFGVYDRRRAKRGPVGEDTARGPGRAYGNSKVIKELVAESYQQDFGFELMTLRPANAYGLGHFWSGSGGAKIQMMLEAGLNGTIARIPQAQTMDFEYVFDRDVGRAIDIATTLPLPQDTVFNIGTGTITTFDDLVNAVRQIFPDLEVEIVPGRPPAVSAGDPLDLSRAKAQLGWEPTYDMVGGLRAYVEDLKAVMNSEDGTS